MQFSDQESIFRPEIPFQTFGSEIFFQSNQIFIFQEYDQVTVKSLSQKQSSQINKHVAGGSSIGTLSYRENFDNEFEASDFKSPPLPTVNGDADHTSLKSIPERLTEELGKGDANNNNLKETPKDAKSQTLSIPAAGEEPQILVEAMFEYEAQDDDELSLTVGTQLTQIMSEDDHGWCKGRLSSGKEGLYPATYVRVVN